MAERADAHIHLFEGGYRSSFSGRPGVRLDETALYASLAEEHHVGRALVVGYAADRWCADNNRWIAGAARECSWVRPLAYLDVAVLCGPHAVETLEALRRDRFVGLSIYLFDPSVASSLARIPDEVITRLIEWNWLVSVNSRGDAWRRWLPLLDRFGGLRILVSHLGLPEAVVSPPSAAVASKALAPVLELAAYPGPRAKLSGFYAATIPGSEYPHRAAWPYVEALVDSFGPGRLLWGSDFSPVLDSLTFPQTYGLFGDMPFLGDHDRRRIEGGNLIDLLDEVVTG